MNPLLNHKIYGQGQSDTPLVVLHGLFGMLDNWTRIAKKLAAHFEVHTLDLRNHGRSFHSQEMSYELMADDVLDYMDRMGLAQISLLGHSMGGKVALKVASTYPFVIDRLIIADMAMRSYPVRHGKILEALSKVNWEMAASRQDLQDELQQKLPMDSSVIQFLLKSAYRVGDDKGYALRFNLSSLIEHIEKLGEEVRFTEKMKFPTLYLFGSHSDYVSKLDIEQANEVFEQFDHVELAAGHWLHAEKPKEFTEAVLKFMR